MGLLAFMGNLAHTKRAHHTVGGVRVAGIVIQIR
jgi:hypothetical protein